MPACNASAYQRLGRPWNKRVHAIVRGCGGSSIGGGCCGIDQTVNLPTGLRNTVNTVPLSRRYTSMVAGPYTTTTSTTRLIHTAKHTKMSPMVEWWSWGSTYSRPNGLIELGGIQDNVQQRLQTPTSINAIISTANKAKVEE
jgi:hypothetical protein